MFYVHAVSILKEDSNSPWTGWSGAWVNKTECLASCSTGFVLELATIGVDLLIWSLVVDLYLGSTSVNLEPAIKEPDQNLSLKDLPRTGTEVIKRLILIFLSTPKCFFFFPFLSFSLYHLYLVDSETAHVKPPYYPLPCIVSSFYSTLKSWLSYLTSLGF